MMKQIVCFKHLTNNLLSFDLKLVSAYKPNNLLLQSLTEFKFYKHENENKKETPDRAI